jgi:ADP-ribosylglycohydrolase
MEKLSARDRVLGCLLGGAAGDALGAPVEFMSLEEIRARFGPDGIGDYVSAYGRIGAITDDTQMTLFTAEGLLRAYVRWNLRGICCIASVISHAYLRWLKTQGIDPPCAVRTDGWLWSVGAMHSRRAPGRTCLSALSAMKAFTEQRAANDSKGAGGIMRVGPVAIFFMDQPNSDFDVFDIATKAAWVTHGHPSGYLSAGAFAVILHTLLWGETLAAGIDRARGFLSSADGGAETLAAIDMAVALANAGGASDEALCRIGGGWVGEEALGIAIYCALRAGSLDDGIRMAVNHDGDSDTTGLLVGQLLGAAHGIGAIPSRWLEQLELRDEITAIGEDLLAYGQWNLDDCDQETEDRIWMRYPGR